MVDQEVVDILSDIKQRVQAAQKQPETTITAGDSRKPAPVLIDIKHRYASLSVLARAWNRLPPLVSNRKGSSARLELWFKGKLKRALKWITWEQVNFNAATHQTFLDLIETLGTQEQRLQSLQQELLGELSELNAAKAEITRDLNSQRTELALRREQLERQQGEISGQRALISSQRSELDARIADFEKALGVFQTSISADTEQRCAELINSFREDLVKEFRERDERLLDEQRVCFKQLSLEISESQVLQDRARRELDQRVAKMEKTGDKR